MKILMITTQRENKNLIVSDDMIADIMTNQKFQAVIKELFIRCRKLNISLVFITQSDFSVPKDLRLNYLIMKINSKRESQNTAMNHSEDIDYKDFVKIYRECTKNCCFCCCFFLTIDTTLKVILQDLENICFILIKMTVTDQFKTIDKKIKANQA